MKTQSAYKVVNNNGTEYIYLYYSHKGQTIRINTRHKYQKSYCRINKNGSVEYKPNKEKYELLNSNLQAQKRLVDYYISKAIEKGLVPTQKDCLQYIKTKQLPFEKPLEKTDFKTALDYYSEFYEFKKQEVKSVTSLKDYLSLWNALQDFERDNKKRFRLPNLNSLKWVYDFRDYLRLPRPCETHLPKEKRVYKTKGGLQDTTINKRIQSLKNWFLWLDKKGLQVFDADVMKYNVAKGEQIINSLSAQEIKQIYEFEGYTERERLVIDVFVLNCFMGLRFADLSRFNKNNFQQLDDGFYYVIYNSKTNKPINIPILPIAKEILEKYDYVLRIYVNAVLNRRIKEILQKYKLLETPVKINTTYNNETVQKKVLLREIVSTHMCRKTFITLALNNNVPINTIMSASGHTQITTLQKYAERKRNFNAFAGMGQ